MVWQARIVTLFPEMFPGPLAHSLAGRSLRNGVWHLSTTQIRDFASDKHRSVDDNAYGPNVGMVLKADVVHNALAAAVDQFHGTPQILFMTPKGVLLTQHVVRKLAQSDGVVILCGHYEGVDDRVIKFWKSAHNLQEISLGDYILSGGEVAALALVDSCVRLLPGVVHNKNSLVQESFELALLEFPQYTRPYEWQGAKVPEILLSGNHKAIAAWQQEQAEEITRICRPDLWELYINQKKNKTCAEDV
ncbi:MAG: tRNA (guanosine(37)-N1)-methyltransferase TrmD [Holosporales bacterium]|jgi:tRNA (guanine37-N1)-methyltransferase|nr:tRNA (guanosine(37)-N1)-methyltransferase TrmD [Holosporales bacterium]